MTNLQLRVLYRQFLFRIVDLEVLSSHAQGDATKLLGQFAGLLVFVSATLSIAAMAGPPKSIPAGLAYAATMITQHFLIATTMLIVGIFAVLSWDATFPDRRDVMVLGPLPVRARTMFAAKVAAVATALGLTILLFHSIMGLAWPASFAGNARPATLPAVVFQPTPAPVPLRDIQSVMDGDLRQAITSGTIAPGTGAGLSIGVLQRGERRVFAYGSAKSDSLFQIGSISKTLTCLMLARMVSEGAVRLDQPVRELLPSGTVAKPEGREITLLDLATHTSGLPRMPSNFRPADRSNPYADYDRQRLYAYLAKQGVAKPPEAMFLYSNLGLGLLGHALAERANRSYPDLLRQLLTAPLLMPDTVVTLSDEQQSRFLQGYNDKQQPIPAWDLDALAGAGAIRSTASDMLTYLEANLHPEKHTPLAGALAVSQRLRANASAGNAIALGWMYNPDSGSYSHGGATAGHTAYAWFHPASDSAAVVLLNTGPNFLLTTEMVGEHIRQRLSGQPALSLETVFIPAPAGLASVVRSYLAYWFTMFAAGVFVYGAVLGVQGLAAQVLPRWLFLRASGFLQMMAFCIIMAVYFLQPGLGGLNDLTVSTTWRVIHLLPSYWFLGLYQQCNGTLHPALAPLASRAWIGLSVVICVTAAAYALAYWRTLRQIVEEPDIVPGARRLGWLPRFGGNVQTAIGQFSIRTLVRSRQHRMILALYLGVGLAVTSLVLKDPMARRQFEDAATDNPWRMASVALWIASIMVMLLSVLGTRVVFALPLDVRANWIFRITGIRDGPGTLAASRRSLWLLAVAPVVLMEALVCYWLWPSWQTVVHLMALTILGMIFAELCLLRLWKIPFTCSYLPGQTRWHFLLLGIAGVVHGSVNAVLLERSALRYPAAIAAMFAVLATVYAAARWRVLRRVAGDSHELRFEEEEDPTVQRLGLNRDGVLALEPPRIG
ncbi:MAG: beta-lactamase family protein [Acidobacteria bacterium]|nr:beta-lactamase family protein [Acidobacteriota bacterium]